MVSMTRSDSSTNRPIPAVPGWLDRARLLKDAAVASALNRTARAVLEVNAGFAGKHRIQPGASLRFERVPGYPVTGAKR